MAVPKLRFKEFKDEYNTYKLKAIVDFYKGNTLSKSDIKENGKFPCILYGELYTKYNEITDKVISYTDRSNKALFYSKLNDVLIPCSGETALDISTSTCILQDHVIIGGDLNVLRPKSQNGKYLSYLLSNKKRLIIAKYAQGDSIVHLYGEKIKNVNIDLPTIEEQEKVSKLLELLNKKIELQKQKIEALKIYKMGLSKKLFDKNPNTNFKDCFYHFGGTALEKYVTENATYKFISIGNYSPEGTYIDNGQRINNIEKAKDKILNRNDLVMVLNDKTSQGNIIGSTILIDEDNKYIYNQRSERIKCNFNIIPRYAWCILNSTNIRNTIFKKSQGGTQIYINFHEIENLKLYVPSIEEQIKLSNVYYFIISKLNIENQKLNYLNTMKKSLLQQMFI